MGTVVLERLSGWWVHRRGRRLVAGALVLATASTVLAGCGTSSGSYTVRAVFASAEGLFPGNAVEVLGVPRGTVTAVRPVGDHVVVTMRVDGAQPLPADVQATLRTPQVLGEPSVELFPGYTTGPRLASGATIPQTRTSVPETIDQLLSDLQRFLGQVNDTSVDAVVTNLAQDLQGQGQALNQLIGQAAGTLQLLADKGTDLGRLNGSLAAITSTLQTRTADIAQLLQSYDAVATTLASDSGPLGDAITQLADASQQLAQLLAPNLQPLQQDVGTITQVGRTLDRNLGPIDQGLASAVSLFSAAGRAYDPVHNWLNLNNQLPPGFTSQVVAGLVRDRLAGICRRVLAHHAAGLSSAQLSTLQQCGNPASGYFDGILALIPGVLNSLSGGGSAPSPSPQQVLATGVAQIPGVSPTQAQAVSQLPPQALAGQPPSSSAGSTGGSLSGPVQLDPTPPQQEGTQSSSSGGGLIGNLLHGLLGTVHATVNLVGGLGHFLGSLL